MRLGHCFFVLLLSVKNASSAILACNNNNTLKINTDIDPHRTLVGGCTLEDDNYTGGKLKIKSSKSGTTDEDLVEIAENTIYSYVTQPKSYVIAPDLIQFSDVDVPVHATTQHFSVVPDQPRIHVCTPLACILLVFKSQFYITPYYRNVARPCGNNPQMFLDYPPNGTRPIVLCFSNTELDPTNSFVVSPKPLLYVSLSRIPSLVVVQAESSDKENFVNSDPIHEVRFFTDKVYVSDLSSYIPPNATGFSLSRNFFPLRELPNRLFIVRTINETYSLVLTENNKLGLVREARLRDRTEEGAIKRKDRILIQTFTDEPFSLKPFASEAIKHGASEIFKFSAMYREGYGYVENKERKFQSGAGALRRALIIMNMWQTEEAKLLDSSLQDPVVDQYWLGEMAYLYCLPTFIRSYEKEGAYDNWRQKIASLGATPWDDLGRVFKFVKMPIIKSQNAITPTKATEEDQSKYSPPAQYARESRWFNMPKDWRKVTLWFLGFTLVSIVTAIIAICLCVRKRNRKKKMAALILEGETTVTV